jgi:hypothetical protein
LKLKTALKLEQQGRFTLYIEKAQILKDGLRR